MKRILSIMLILSSLLLTSCTRTDLLAIGGADGPTKIILAEKSDKIKGQFGEQYKKNPIKMFNVDGELYYDTGLISDISPRCGTLDGSLTKSVGENEIPHKSGEANFEAEGYQHATSITKEVNIDGEWIIFKKYDRFERTIEDLKFCYYIKGHLNNAAVDSEIIVLSEYEGVTFNDVYEPLLSSQYQAESGKGSTIYNRICSDKWGLTLSSDNVTTSGMTIKFEQFGGSVEGELQTGSWFSLEKSVNDEWKPVETNPLIDYAWEDVAYVIKKNDITELKAEWEWLYGKLTPGFYKITKEIINFKASGHYDKDLYELHFTIE